MRIRRKTVSGGQEVDPLSTICTWHWGLMPWYELAPEFVKLFEYKL